MGKKFRLGISTCPNDTFIFDALINKKIDNQGIDFEVIFDDIKNLNKYAFSNELDIVKVSFHTFAYVSKYYQILKSGNALGYNCGPLLIAKNSNIFDNLETLTAAIPGEYTSANLLLKLFFPNLKAKKAMIFSEIEDAVLKGHVDCGLIIHESRFTYQQKGLVKIADLGELWEQKTNLPVPLGGIIANRHLDSETKNKISLLIKESIEFAYKNPEQSMDFIRSKAQVMDDKVIKEHIKTYVNSESIELSTKAIQAIELMLDKVQQTGNIPKITKPIFA